MEGDAVGEVDIRSLSGASSEAFLLRPDMLDVLKASVDLVGLLVDVALRKMKEEKHMDGPELEGERRVPSRCGAEGGRLGMTVFMTEMPEGAAPCVGLCDGLTSAQGCVRV